MPPRGPPAPLNLNNTRDDEPLPPPRFPNFHMDLPSPRSGEAPPALSPLDAFALHSRMLARKFEEEAQNGRRLSRLPHNTVAKELANRPTYFGGANEGGMSDVPEVQEEARPTTRDGLTVTNNDSRERPMSHYPMLGRVSRQGTDGERGLGAGTPFFDAIEEQPDTIAPQDDYFGMPRGVSPEPVDPRVNVKAPSPTLPSLTNSVDSFTSTQARGRKQTDGSTRSQRSDRGLLPPRSPGIPQSPRSIQSSIRAVRQDSGEEGMQTTTTHSYSPSPSYLRKYSGSSGMSRPHSPFSPGPVHHVHQSPSISSEHSFNAYRNNHPRPMPNFSRPDRPMSPDSRPSMDTRPSFDSRLSMDSRPSLDVLRREASITSSATRASLGSGPPSRHGSSEEVAAPFARDAREMPPSDSEVIEVSRATQGPDTGAGTYTYAKFTLPRGRAVERNSLGFRTSWIENQFSWDKEGNAKPANGLAEPPKIHERKLSDGLVLRQAPNRPQSPTLSHLSVNDERPSRDRAFSSANRSKSADPRGTPKPKPSHQPSPSVNTNSTDRTVREFPLSKTESVLSSDTTPEDHLEIGIQAHTAGHTNKSTYHLRLAARAGLPTAMLLYALACRHGWGMRPNQEEGVMWLRKAIDGANLEMGDIEQTLVNVARRSGQIDPAVAAIERRKRKAQFSLAVYELGISYMNGWGCPKDKPLALKCFEVAGNWGDCDALAEAGYCYTQGLGCKKDMKKAAALYRKAAAGGMSMAGNSWIYKPKYMVDVESEKSKKEEEVTPPREGRESKSGRTRSKSIWGRSKRDKGG